MFFSNDSTSHVNKLSSVESTGFSASLANSYENSAGFRPLVVLKDSELFLRSTDETFIDNKMDSSKFTHLEFNKKNENTGDDTSMSNTGSPLVKNNLPMRKSSSHSFLRLGTPLNVPNTSKSEGSVFHLLGTRLDTSSPKPGAIFSRLDSPIKQLSPKTESIQMAFDDTHNSQKRHTQFVEAGVEVPGLEHRISMDSQDYNSMYSSSRLNSFTDPGSFFDLAQYKARLEEQLSHNKSDLMRRAECNDSLEYRLFGETQEYNNLLNYSSSVSSEQSNVSGELGIIETTQFDRFSHFGYSFNKLLNSLTWLASLHLSCRSSNLYLNRYNKNNNQYENYQHISSRYNSIEFENENMDNYMNMSNMDSYNNYNTNNYNLQKTTVNQYPVNYVSDHDMTPEVQRTMMGYPVYSNSIKTPPTLQNMNTNTCTNYTVSNTHFATINQGNLDNIINIDNDFNMDNNYNYSQPNFSNRNYDTYNNKIKDNNNSNNNNMNSNMNNFNSSQNFNTQNYNRRQGYLSNQQNQLNTSYEQHNPHQQVQHQNNNNQQRYQQTSNYNYHTTVPGPTPGSVPPEKLGTELQQKQKNYRGKYFYNNRVVNGVEQEVYDLDVDLGITYSRKV